MLGIAIFWFALQLIMLPLYPRLEEPGFKIALRNAAVLLARNPLPFLTMLLIVWVMVALTLMIQPCTWFVLLGVFSFTAVFCNRMVGAWVKKELGDDIGRANEKGMGFNLDDTDEA
jgi:hypothetical protein